MRPFFALLLCCLLMTLSVTPALALNPGEALADPQLEARAHDLTRELRCLVCQGESIDESNAPFAADLRRLVRTQIAAGDSDEEIRAYLVKRYGDYVLLRPPLALHTLILWIMPFALLVVAGFAVVRHKRRGGTLS